MEKQFSEESVVFHGILLLFQEMEKHPFFMTKFPEAGEEMSPLMEGLQQLKYDPLENTPEGNHVFFLKKHYLPKQAHGPNKNHIYSGCW